MCFGVKSDTRRQIHLIDSITKISIRENASSKSVKLFRLVAIRCIAKSGKHLSRKLNLGRIHPGNVFGEKHGGIKPWHEMKIPPMLDGNTCRRGDALGGSHHITFACHPLSRGSTHLEYGWTLLCAACISAICKVIA